MNSHIRKSKEINKYILRKKGFVKKRVMILSRNYFFITNQIKTTFLHFLHLEKNLFLIRIVPTFHFLYSSLFRSATQINSHIRKNKGINIFVNL